MLSIDLYKKSKIDKKQRNKILKDKERREKAIRKEQEKRDILVQKNTKKYQEKLEKRSQMIINKKIKKHQEGLNNTIRKIVGKKTIKRSNSIVYRRNKAYKLRQKYVRLIAVDLKTGLVFLRDTLEWVDPKKTVINAGHVFSKKNYPHMALHPHACWCISRMGNKLQGDSDARWFKNLVDRGVLTQQQYNAVYEEKENKDLKALSKRRDKQRFIDKCEHLQNLIDLIEEERGRTV